MAGNRRRDSRDKRADQHRKGGKKRSRSRRLARRIGGLA
jgi:hypothetical protein